MEMKYQYYNTEYDNKHDECFICGMPTDGVCQEPIGSDNPCGEPAKYHILFDWTDGDCESEDTLCYDVCEKHYQELLRGNNYYALCRPTETIITKETNHDQ